MAWMSAQQGCLAVNANLVLRSSVNICMCVSKALLGLVDLRTSAERDKTSLLPLTLTCRHECDAGRGHMVTVSCKAASVLVHCMQYMQLWLSMLVRSRGGMYEKYDAQLMPVLPGTDWNTYNWNPLS